MAKLSNRFWFQLHGWCSLPIWLVFCFVCLTGTIAVISHELTWLTNPAARASNPQQLPAKPLAEIVDVVKQAYPTADIRTVMVFEPYLVHAVIFADHDKPQAIAYVNPYSGAIQQVNQGLTFIGFMRALHGWLLFPWQSSYSIGYYLVSMMALVMLGALITGLIIYKKFWQSFTKPKLRVHQGKKTFLADLHRLAGVWSLWFLLLMSATGLWYLTQAILWHADIDISPHAPLVHATELPEPLSTSSAAAPNISAKAIEPTIDFAKALTIAQQRFTDFQPKYITMPEHSRDMYHLMGRGDWLFYDNYAYKLSINPWTGAIAAEQSPAKMTPLQHVMHLADPLHYGTLAGIWTKLIWFLFGLLITGMSITGFMLWQQRTVKLVRDDKTHISVQEIRDGR
jgi:uncharacterized iron-regulated membrane protein